MVYTSCYKKQLVVRLNSVSIRNKSVNSLFVYEGYCFARLNSKLFGLVVHIITLYDTLISNDTLIVDCQLRSFYISPFRGKYTLLNDYTTFYMINITPRGYFRSYF